MNTSHQNQAAHFGLSWVVPVTCIIGLLRFGREVLEPIAVAGILSLALAPLVRLLIRAGLSRTPATLLAVGAVGATMLWIGVVLAMQLAAVAGELPKYSATIRGKVDQVRQITEQPFERLGTQIDSSGSRLAPRESSAVRNDKVAEDRLPMPQPSLPTLEGPPSPQQALARLFSALWGPLGEAGIVIVLLIFILLEREVLRNRLVRLTGSSPVARTIQALADAAEGVSSYFFTQLMVNVAFGVLVCIALAAIGIPHPGLFATLAGLLRLVPYVGILIAGAIIAGFAAAADPGWTLCIVTMLAFAGFELLFAYLIEPKIYGHRTGIAPLMIIVSALFWSAVWGPVGLLMSTPLTLCLMVIARQVKSLEPLAIALGDVSDITLGQRFYQRALSGESEEILKDARAMLRRSNFAKYCDDVLLPALAQVRDDSTAGHLRDMQHERVRSAIAAVTEALTESPPVRRLLRSRPTTTLLHANVGAHLQRARESRLGRWQGSLDVPPRSVVLCVALNGERDLLLAELLVRALRERGIDARSVVIHNVVDKPNADASTLISTTLLICPEPDSVQFWKAACEQIRCDIPHVLLAAVNLSAQTLVPREVDDAVDLVVNSFEEAVAFASPAGSSAKSGVAPV